MRDFKFREKESAHLLWWLWPPPHWNLCGWWQHICMFRCHSVSRGRWKVFHPWWYLYLLAGSVCPSGSTRTAWDESREQGNAGAGHRQVGASPGRAGRWHMEELHEGEENDCHEEMKKKCGCTVSVFIICFVHSHSTSICVYASL